MAQGKRIQSSPKSSETNLNQTQNWSWEAENHYFISNKQNQNFYEIVYEIDSFDKFSFFSLKIIVATLINVGNAKHQNNTS